MKGAAERYSMSLHIEVPPSWDVACFCWRLKTMVLRGFEKKTCLRFWGIVDLASL